VPAVRGHLLHLGAFLGDNSGAGRVRMSKITSSSSLMFSRTWRSCSSFRLFESFSSSSNSSSMLRLPAL
jgi:hypothetical protein